MTDIAPAHLFLRQCLLPVLLRPVVVIVMYHGTAAVVPEFLRRHRRALQIPAEYLTLRQTPRSSLRSGSSCDVRTAPADTAATEFYRGYALTPAACRG